VNNRVGFPKLMQVETASGSETIVIDQQTERLLNALRPATVTTNNSYTQALRIRQWAKRGVVLFTPALKWTKGCDAEAYHRYIGWPEHVELLRSRRTAMEPLFDLVAKALGTTGHQKPLPMQRLDNVRTCLALATLTVQVAMIANSIWGLPLRIISTIATAFTGWIVHTPQLIAGEHLRVPVSPENSVVHTWRTMPAVRSSLCNALGRKVTQQGQRALPKIIAPPPVPAPPRPQAARTTSP